jgi:predicted Zn-ribbon and HTH transcriptional regulator
LYAKRVKIIRYLSNPKLIHAPKTVYDELEEISQSISRYKRRLEIAEYQYNICILNENYLTL